MYIYISFFRTKDEKRPVIGLNLNCIPYNLSEYV